MVPLFAFSLLLLLAAFVLNVFVCFKIIEWKKNNDPETISVQNTSYHDDDDEVDDKYLSNNLVLFFCSFWMEYPSWPFKNQLEQCSIQSIQVLNHKKSE